MPRVPINSTAYAGKSVIASGQEQVNLYSELNPDPDAPVKFTNYPTPGTLLYATPTAPDNSRGCYRTSIGTAYHVVGQNIYFVTSIGTEIFIGAIADRPSQIRFADNGIVLVLVDGVSCYVIDLETNAIGIVTDPNFYSADFVVLLDTFFVFNVASTNQFFLSVSNADFILLTTVGAFDPLDIAAKAGFNDPIVGLATSHRELWLIGALTSEVWIGTGAADFYFQQVQGAYINHGCGAAQSIASQDVLVFFLMQDQQGKNIVVQGQGYELEEISTPRIVSEFNKYADTSDAIGFCFQVEDHSYYAIVFPTANKGWLYDLTTSARSQTRSWYEWNWIDPINGSFNRPRLNCIMFAFGYLLGGDWETGNLLKLTIDALTDYTSDSGNGPITRVRTFPHLVDNNQRITYTSFEAEFEVGTAGEDEEPEVSLSWSDNKGVSYGNPVMQSMGRIGDYLAVPQWSRLGMARDRVFKLSWSTTNKTALNGGFVEFLKGRT